MHLKFKPLISHNSPYRKDCLASTDDAFSTPSILTADCSKLDVLFIGQSTVFSIGKPT